MRGTALPKGHFIGQIPPNWNEYLQGGTWKDAHNNRVKVRIPAKHSKSGEIPDSDLPWAIVEQSTFTGMRNGVSVGLWGGEWVKGYFLDEGEQIPVITGVLSVNIVDGEIKNSENGSTGFRKVKRFNGGFIAQAYQMVGGPKPDASAEPSKEEIKKGTQSLPSPEEAAETGEELPGFVPEAEAAAEAAEAQTAAEASPPPGPQATLPVATDIPQQIPPPATYPPQEVGSKTADGATVSSGIQTKYPGGPRYQTVTSGLGDGAPQTRWIDNPRDPKFDKARASAGRAPRADKTEPDGILW